MSRYAKDTKVPTDRSRSEIERTLRNYGCGSFAFGWAPEGAMVQFGYRGRQVKIAVPAVSGHSQAATERKERQRWRVLLLLIKAQIEAVEIGLAKFEEAFLPWMLLGDGSTVAQTMVPKLPPSVEPKRLKAVS